MVEQAEGHIETPPDEVIPKLMGDCLIVASTSGNALRSARGVPCKDMQDIALTFPRLVRIISHAFLASSIGRARGC